MLASYGVDMKSVDVNCWPGKMSVAAVRPRRYAGSAIAPTSTSSGGIVVDAYIERLTTRLPGPMRDELLRDEHRRRGALSFDAYPAAI